ncbi:hypothetical protein J2Z21_004506 [Streptomyces griseochromogenes]|uniref:Uncharacterized protein n=1 Tax=Streptomyces griseochromogenes TaxID=68214 RepID=A0ABS4LVT6_9ACTN|nr:hypothetical protein [Streptomyces griseochromogenes]MBP2051535.1 hypothetical protein [Streptomyces griseochromogenes]
MPTERPETRLAPCARLPRTCRDWHIVHSSADAFGRAHWLLVERPPEQQGPDPYEALVVIVADGSCHETCLGAGCPGGPVPRPCPTEASCRRPPGRARATSSQ